MKQSDMFISLHKVAFCRRNSFFSFFLDDLAEETFGMAELYLGTSRAMAGISGRNRTHKITMTYNGLEIPYALSSTPSELIMESDFGTARFCVAEQGLIRAQVSGGVGLRFFADLSQYREEVRDLLNGSYVHYMGQIGNWTFSAISGGKLDVSAPWEWRRTRCSYFRADFIPEGVGPLEIAIEENIIEEGVRRDAYPDYAKSAEAVQREFEEYLAIMPKRKDPAHESVREIAAFTSWAHLIDSSVIIKRPTMIMMRKYIAGAAAWQQGYNAIAHSGDIKLSWQFLLSMFDHQRENGVIPDFVNDAYVFLRMGKPPFFGFAFLWLKKYADFDKITLDDITQLYHPLSRYTEWWFKYRNPSGDGICQYENPDESGWDDATVFKDGGAVKCADLSAFLVLQMEALGIMANMLGLFDEGHAWKTASEDLLENMIKTFWNGEQFVSYQVKTGKTLVGDSIVAYQPIILGKRLPQEIIDKISSVLSEEGAFLTPYGLASEKITSPYVDPFRGWTDGPIISPVQFMFVLGLHEAGETELASLIAGRYCDLLAKTGMHHIHNPFDGSPQTKGRDFQARQPWPSWSSSTYLTLSKYC